MKDLERRCVPVPVEIRAAANGKKTLVGYAALYDSPSEDLGGFTEVIRAGAFDRALREAQDILCRSEHDTRLLLGRSSAGTLRLSTDAKGLRYEVDVPDTQAGRDTATLVARGDIRGSSFAFTLPSDEAQRWSKAPDGGVLRELLDLDLFDVAPTANPAYSQTTVSARALDAAKGVVKMAKPKATRADFKRAMEMGQIRHLTAEQRAASYEEKIEAIWMALYELLGSPFCDGSYDSYFCVEATFDDRVIVEKGYQYLSFPLSWGTDGKPVFGEPTPVEIEYVPTEAGTGEKADAATAAMPPASMQNEGARGVSIVKAVEPFVADALRAAGGAADLPLADREKPWDAAEAEGHVRNWASQDHSGDKSEVDWNKYGRAFFWRSEDPKGFGDFKLGFADVASGQLKAVPRGIFAVAAVLSGSRGGVDIPEADQNAIKAKVGAYYARMREEFRDDNIIPPWERSAEPPDLELERLRMEFERG